MNLKNIMCNVPTKSKKNKKNIFDKDFEEVWESYPKKQGKLIAQTAFNRLKKQGFTVRQIEQAVFKYVELTKDTDHKYIKHGSRFFGEGIYDFLSIESKKHTNKFENSKPKSKKLRKINIDINNFEESYNLMIETFSRMKYSDYLLTQHWKHFRLQALDYFGRRCGLCNGSNQELAIHHKTYENRGRETFKDVIILCATCHEKHHEKKIIIKNL